MKGKCNQVFYRTLGLPVALTCIFSLIAERWVPQQERLVFSMFGGIEFYTKDFIDLYAMGRWLFSFGFFFFIAGLNMMISKKIMCFALHRYDSFGKWWRRYFFEIHLKICLCFLITITVWSFADNGKIQMNETVLVCLTYLMHLLCMVSMLVLFDMVLQSKAMMGIFIVIEGFFYVLSVSHECDCLVSGMYVRSSWYLDEGFYWAWVYIIEILISLFCFFTVPLLWKSGYFERRELLNGKSD